MKRVGEASVVLCRKDGHFSRIEGSLLRSFRNADDGTVVVRGVSRPARTRLGREKPALTVMIIKSEEAPEFEGRATIEKPCNAWSTG